MNKYIPSAVFENPVLNERYEKFTHPCGLNIYIFKKKMTSIYAIFGTHYGSIHNSFSVENDNSVITVPDGIAHFLEHKLFTNEDGSDSFERFSDFGADANAYTSFNKTAYLFSCTDRLTDSLGELIDFVTHPYFTKKSVDSEIGIISEEIRMYDDTPSDRCFYGMLEGMYENHSIRRNICGSCESIREITPELLYKCYSAFYQFSNMALIICGDVNTDEVLDTVYAHLPNSADNIKVVPKNENECEKRSVFKPYVHQKMQVSKPIFNIGFKDIDVSENGNERQRKDAAMSILNEMLFSRAGELYSSLYDRGLISPAFSYGYNISESCAYNSLAGEADDPKLVLSEIQKYLKKVEKEGLSKSDFERGKRVMYAEFVKSFDSTESIANNLFNFICEDCDLLSYANIIDSISFEEVCDLFKTSFFDDSVTLSVIYPL